MFTPETIDTAKNLFEQRGQSFSPSIDWDVRIADELSQATETFSNFHCSIELIASNIRIQSIICCPFPMDHRSLRGKAAIRVDDLSPSSETAHRILRKIKGSSIRWPFEKGDILKRINSLERCMQVINASLQIDQTNLLLDIDYRAILDKLPVASDAYFDSFDESSKARCLPGTRVDLLQDVSNWAKNPDSHAVFWLNGMAGTGKSTISRTISEMFANEHRLGASFFFKRGEAGRGGLAKFFTTIAADLVRRQPIFAPRIKQAIEAELGISTKSASDQFKQLILGPLSTIPQDSSMANPIIILKFFLTSRPELPLRLGFRKIEGTYKDLVLHEVPVPIIEGDILKFLEYELLKIRNDYNLTRPDDLKLPESWPCNHNIEILVKMAVPLFIFASTTCRFIADCRHGNPQRQLQRVLQYETKATRSRLDATYLPILDQQLDGLSSSEKVEVAEEFRAIVGTIIILANPLSIIALSKMLDISKETISNRLDMLHSVLGVPSSLTMPHINGGYPTRNNQPSSTPRVSEFLLRHFLHWLEALSLMERTREVIGFLQMLQTLVEPESGSKTFTFLKDAEQFARTHASTIEDRTVKVWGLATGECLQAMTGHTDFILAVDFSHDSSRLMSASYDHTIRIWHTETGECIRILTSHSGFYTSAVFSPDSTLIASGSDDSTVRIWNPETGECKHELLGHETRVVTTVFSRDSTLVASTCYDVIRIWSTDSGLCQSIMQQTEGYSPWLAMFSPDSTRLVVVYHNGALQFWRVDTEICERRIRFEIDGLNLNHAALSHDWKYFLYTTTLKKTLLWRIDTEQCVYTSNARIGFTSSVAFSPDSTCFALASVSGDIGIWDVMEQDQNQLMADPTAMDIRPDNIKFSRDSSLVATASLLSNTIMVWDARTGCCIQKLRFPGDTVEDVVFSHDSSLLASVSLDLGPPKRHVCIWKLDTGLCTDVEVDLNSLLGRHCFAFSHDLQFVAISRIEAVYLRGLGKKGWDHTNEKGHWFCCPVFSHDSAILGAATTRGQVLLWETATGQLIYQYSIPGTEIECIAFSYDLGLIAVATKACHIHIIHRDNSECIRKIEAKPGNIDTLAFTYDASFIGASIGGKKRISIWQIGTGQLMHNMHHWSMGRYLQFDGSTQHIPTDTGADSQKSGFNSVDDHCCGYSVHPDGRWIVWGERKLLELPKRYETRKSAVSDRAIVLGYELDKIIILTTSKDGTDLEHVSKMDERAT
ncbi:hypothetical protein J3F84DRAFT_405089 [Trichoderma pleuroticola]